MLLYFDLKSSEMLNPMKFDYPEIAFAPLFQHLTKDQAPRMIRSKECQFEFTEVHNLDEFELNCKSYSDDDEALKLSLIHI